MEYRLCQQRFEALKLISPTATYLRLQRGCFAENFFLHVCIIIIVIGKSRLLYIIYKNLLLPTIMFMQPLNLQCTNRESVITTNLTKWNTFGIMGVFVWIISLMREPLAFSSLYIFDIALVTCGGTSSLYGDLNASISSSRWSQLTA